MATKITVPLKREVEIDGKPYTLAIATTGITLTEKRHRSPAFAGTFTQLLRAGAQQVANKEAAK
jgi:hypothetical protein